MPAPRGVHRRRRRGLAVALLAVLAVAAAPALLVQADSDGLPALLRGGPGVSNHPVNVAPPPGMRIPADMPLSPSGTVTCLTCHERLPANGRGEPHLRGMSTADTSRDTLDFCARCHAEDAERTARSMHWLAVPRAHMMADGSSSRSGGSLDAESRRCMECHDGVSAKEFNNSTPWNRGDSYLGDKKRDHPVGVPYPRRRPDGYDSTFRQAALLPKQMRLPEGKVSCVSCHDLYATERNLLSVPIEESRLCLTCHAMD